MRRAQSGFGLLELMLALGIGLVLLAAVSQVFTSAHQAWRLQSTAVRMNDEARQALLRMAQVCASNLATSWTWLRSLPLPGHCRPIGQA